MAHPLGLFITGTDTGVGKTYVAATIARQLQAAGRRVGVYKPAASGCRVVAGELVSDDAERLWEAAGRPLTLAEVCPQRFAAPLAPHLAARAEGREVDRALLRKSLDPWIAYSEIVLVEGAGGLLSPISDDDYVADLAEAFGFPLVVVAPNALGTINQTLQTLVTASCYGLEVAGVVLNESAPPPAEDVSAASNLQELVARTVPPVLGQLRFAARDFEPHVDWFRMAHRLGG